MHRRQLDNIENIAAIATFFSLKKSRLEDLRRPFQISQLHKNKSRHHNPLNFSAPQQKLYHKEHRQPRAREESEMVS
jgi:hypothetical protein